MIDDIVDKLANNTALSSGERDELLTYLQQFMDTTTQINGLFGVGAYPRLSARLYSGGIISGTGTDPDAASTTFTGTFLIYPPITLPNGDYANVGGMNAGVIQWYGNSTNGKYYTGAGAVLLDTSGITINAPGAIFSYTDGISNFGSIELIRGNGLSFISLVGTALTVPDPGFEVGGSDWTLGANAAISTTQAHSGTYSLVLSRSSGNAVSAAFIAVTGTKGMLEFWMYGDTVDSLLANIACYDAGNNSTGTANSVHNVFAASVGWHKYQVLGTYPTNTTQVKISLSNNHVGGSGHPIYVDDVAFYDGEGFQLFSKSVYNGLAVEGGITALGAIAGSNLSGTNTGDQTVAGLGATPNDGWIADTNTWSYSSGIRTQAYTNDPAAGSDIVLNVASTSGFVIGDPVTVSSSSGSENTYIVNLVANTSITVKVLALNHTTTSPLITLLGNTFVISANADMTSLVGVGDRIKLIQSATQKYFIVTAVGAFSGGATLVTVFGGTDYTLANASITTPFYSHVKNPFGFPPNPDKWTVAVSDTTNATQATPTAATWYNLNEIIIPVPIGAWELEYDALEELIVTVAAVTTEGVRITLSTANNTESNAAFTKGNTVVIPVVVGGVTRWGVTFGPRVLAVTTRTPYYLNGFAGAGGTSISFRGDVSTTKIYLVCAYL